ncbi:MAG: hypothetical protein ACKOHG_11110 [Planctomycetia bacterium]
MNAIIRMAPPQAGHCRERHRYARNQNVADAPGTTANVAIARQTIHHSGLRCSRLDLPVIP